MAIIEVLWCSAACGPGGGRVSMKRAKLGQSFEERLDLVMAGSSIQNARMNIGARTARKPFKEVVHQFHLQISHTRSADFCIDYRGGASAKVDGRQTESFVHWHNEITGAQNTPAISQC